MNTKVHVAHDVKKALDHRVDTRRNPAHRKGPMDAARLVNPRITIVWRFGPGVVSEYTTTARAPMV
jgi:hypothetical protein